MVSDRRGECERRQAKACFYYFATTKKWLNILEISPFFFTIAF